MPIKLDCPRCKQRLAVPRKKAGEYVTCPRCRGRLWVPDDAGTKSDSGEVGTSGDFPAAIPSGSGPAETPPATGAGLTGSGTSPGASSGNVRAGSAPLWVAAPSTLSVPLPAAPPIVAPGAPQQVPAPPAAPPPGALPPEPTPGPGMTPLPTIPLPPGLSPVPVPMPPMSGLPAAGPTAMGSTAPAMRTPQPSFPVAGTRLSALGPVPGGALPAKPHRTARFIAAESAAAAIQPAADGKLPELRLDEGQREEAADAKGTTVNPLVLMAVLCLSVALSVTAVLVDLEGTNAANSRLKSEARTYIEMNYFSGMDKAKPLEPYQVYLREARQAFARGDYRTERQKYRKVLDLLRAERGPFERGLTGSRSNDKNLEQRLLVLLGSD